MTGFACNSEGFCVPASTSAVLYQLRSRKRNSSAYTTGALTLTVRLKTCSVLLRTIPVQRLIGCSAEELPELEIEQCRHEGYESTEHQTIRNLTHCSVLNAAAESTSGHLPGSRRLAQTTLPPYVCQALGIPVAPVYTLF